jgi:hypothetical protein
MPKTSEPRADVWPVRIEDIPPRPWLLPSVLFGRGILELRAVPFSKLSADKKSPDHRQWYTIMLLEESGLVVQVTDQAWARKFIAWRAVLLEAPNGRPN